MDAVSRKLLFRIGEIGFSLDLDDLVEICEQVVERIEPSMGDPEQDVVGSLLFRSSRVPVLSLSHRLGLPTETLSSALILDDADGCRALLVSQVIGFVPEDELVEQDLPRLLQRDGWRCFNSFCLYEGQPFLKLRLSSCVVGGGG